MLALQTAKDDFITKLTAAKAGGPAQTAAKNNARGVLPGMLRNLPAYVQIQSNNDMAVLISSGFQAMSTDCASNPLETPKGLGIKNGGSGVLVAKVIPVKNTRLYEGRIKADADWLDSAFNLRVIRSTSPSAP